MKRLFILFFLMISIACFTQTKTISSGGENLVTKDKDGNVVITGMILGDDVGGMTVITTAGIQTIGTGGTFEKLFEGNMVYTGYHLELFTEADGRLAYKGANTIHLTLTAAISVESGEIAQVTNYRFAVKGATIEDSNMPITFTAQDHAADVTLKWFCIAETNDYYEIYATSDTNGDTFTILNLVFAVEKH